MSAAEVALGFRSQLLDAARLTFKTRKPLECMGQFFRLENHPLLDCPLDKQADIN